MLVLYLVRSSVLCVDYSSSNLDGVHNSCVFLRFPFWGEAAFAPITDPSALKDLDFKIHDITCPMYVWNSVMLAYRGDEVSPPLRRYGADRTDNIDHGWICLF